MEHTLNMRNLLANNVRKARTSLKLTQQELAEQTGVIPLTISNIERGDAWPKPETLEKIAEALKIAPYRLFLNETDKLIPSDQVIKDNSRILAIIKSEFEKTTNTEISENKIADLNSKADNNFSVKHSK